MNEQLDLFPDTVCQWKVDGDMGYYTTGCGKDFVLTFFVTKENSINYCCYCGKPLGATISDPDQ